MRPLVDKESSWLRVIDVTDVFPLASVVDLLIEADSNVLCSSVTVSLWLSSE